MTVNALLPDELHHQVVAVLTADPDVRPSMLRLVAAAGRRAERADDLGPLVALVAREAADPDPAAAPWRRLADRLDIDVPTVAP